VEDEEDDVRALAWRLVDKLLPARGAHASQRQLRDRSDCYTQQSQRGEGGGRLRGGGGGGGEVTFRAHDSIIGGGLGRTEEGWRMDEGAEVQMSQGGPSSCGEMRAAERGRAEGVGVSGEDEELEYGERVGRVLLRSVRGSAFADTRVRAIRLLARFFFSCVDMCV
jgi:hypothetical protein